MTTHYNANGTVDKWDKSAGAKIEYVEDRRDYSKVIMFVVIPIVLLGVYVLLTHM